MLENDGFTLLIVLALGLLLVVAMVVLVMQLRHRFAFDDGASVDKPAAKPATDLKKAIFVVNGEEFEIFYKPKNHDEVVRLIDLIKYSLSLLKETKYSDIIASRSKECEGLIRQLPKHTSLKSSELERILAQFREFVASLQPALDRI